MSSPLPAACIRRGSPGRAELLWVSGTSTGELITTLTKPAHRPSVAACRVGFAVDVVVDALLVSRWVTW
jgi:hypothetical protein